VTAHSFWPKLSWSSNMPTTLNAWCGCTAAAKQFFCVLFRLFWHMWTQFTCRNSQLKSPADAFISLPNHWRCMLRLRCMHFSGPWSQIGQQHAKEYWGGFGGAAVLPLEALKLSGTLTQMTVANSKIQLRPPVFQQNAYMATWQSAVSWQTSKASVSVAQQVLAYSEL